MHFLWQWHWFWLNIVTECHPNTSEHSYSQEERNTAELNNILKDSQSDQSFTLKTINSELSLVSKNGSSVLFNRDPLSLMDPHVFVIILLEIKEKCPYLLGVLVCGLGSKGTTQRQVCSIVTMYAMFLHARNNKASAMQRMYTALAIRFHADNEVINVVYKPWSMLHYLHGNRIIITLLVISLDLFILYKINYGYKNMYSIETSFRILI